MKINQTLKQGFRHIFLAPNRQWIIFLLTALIFASIAWRSYSPGGAPLLQATPPPPEVQPTEAADFLDPNAPNLLPEEWAENYRQTDGIVFGGVIMVLVIVGGTLGVIQHKPKKR